MPKKTYCCSITYRKLDKPTVLWNLKNLKLSIENGMHLNHYSLPLHCFNNSEFCLEVTFLFWLTIGVDFNWLHGLIGNDYYFIIVQY
jgi:hypothetical protein